MSATYTHTKRKLGFTLIFLRFLAFLYFLTFAASLAYLWLSTQDRFISTAEFKVSRQSLTGGDAGFAQFALPGLSDSGSADSQLVIGFVTSADLLLALEKDFRLADHFKAPAKDFVFRLERDANLEERLEYYRKRIAAHFDAQTGMTVLTVDTFDPTLSRDVAVSLLERAGKFINTVNKDIADQQLDFVRSEVERTAKRVDDLNAELLTLQNENNFISPDEVIRATLAAIEKLRTDNLQAQAELATIERDSPNSPRIESLRSRLRSLEELISVESAKLSGPEKSRLNQLLVRYKLLEQKLAFAIQLRTGAESLLEKNRMEAAANSRFLSVIQSPYLPEDIGLPRRPYASITLITLGSLMFLIFRAITKAIFSMV
jgi:capsular polysaccharide transport system permease protein